MEKMMMPAYYNVLSTEEMTYTEGGANATMTEALLCWLIPPSSTLNSAVRRTATNLFFISKTSNENMNNILVVSIAHWVKRDHWQIEQ